MPSLPVLGSDRPPVARTTTAERIVRPSASPTVNAFPATVTDATRAEDRTAILSRAASRSRASSTVRARLVSGKSLPSSSSCSATPSSSKKSAARGAGNARSTCRTNRGDPPQKSCSVTVRLVTLHREPPLTRIFAPMWAAPSRHTIRIAGAARAAKIAVASPAAPAPTTTTSHAAASGHSGRACSRPGISTTRPGW